jgi:hypothetical protein
VPIFEKRTELPALLARSGVTTEARASRAAGRRPATALTINPETDKKPNTVGFILKSAHHGTSSTAD